MDAALAMARSAIAAHQHTIQVGAGGHGAHAPPRGRTAMRRPLLCAQDSRHRSAGPLHAARQAHTPAPLGPLRIRPAAAAAAAGPQALREEVVRLQAASLESDEALSQVRLRNYWWTPTLCKLCKN